MSNCSLSYEEAVRLFREWGFRVEPGPGPQEVTLITEGPDHRTYAVYETDMLPGIACVALRVRNDNVVRALFGIATREEIPT
jgi:hypothetical protein